MHILQPDLPEEPWYVPALQRAQVAVPFPGAMLPGRQSTQLVELLLPGIGFALPGPQAMHADEFDLPRAGL